MSLKRKFVDVDERNDLLATMILESKYGDRIESIVKDFIIENKDWYENNGIEKVDYNTFKSYRDAFIEYTNKHGFSRDKMRMFFPLHKMLPERYFQEGELESQVRKLFSFILVMCDPMIAKNVMIVQMKRVVYRDETTNEVGHDENLLFEVLSVCVATQLKSPQIGSPMELKEAMCEQVNLFSRNNSRQAFDIAKENNIIPENVRFHMCEVSEYYTSHYNTNNKYCKGFDDLSLHTISQLTGMRIVFHQIAENTKNPGKMFVARKFDTGVKNNMDVVPNTINIFSWRNQSGHVMCGVVEIPDHKHRQHFDQLYKFRWST